MYTDLGSLLLRTGLAGGQGEIRTGFKTGFQLHRLPVRSLTGKGQTHTRVEAGLNRQNFVRSGVSGPVVHAPHRSTHSNRKASPPRATPHETHTVALEKQLEGPIITGKGDSSSQVAPPSLKMVAGGKQCATRSIIAPTKACSAALYRCIKRRVGHSLKRKYCKGNLVPSRKQVAHKPSGTKGGLSGLKKVQRPLFEQHSSGGHRQRNGGCLYQQGRGGEVGPSVCPSAENPDLVYQETGNTQSSTHPRVTECDSRQTIQTKRNHSNRIVPSPSKSSKPLVPGGTSPKWPCLPPGSTTNFHSLFHWFQTPKHRQWMHSDCPERVWIHMPTHQQPSWAKWWRSCRTTHATE